MFMIFPSCTSCSQQVGNRQTFESEVVLPRPYRFLLKLSKAIHRCSAHPFCSTI